jgi:hypothetical protein
MDLSIELRFPAPVPASEIPEALMQGLQYRGVKASEIASATRNSVMLRKCANCIADVTGIPLVDINMKPARRAPDVRLAFTWSLMRCGVTTRQLSDIVCSEHALDRIAAIMMPNLHVGAGESRSYQNMRVLNFVSLPGVTKHHDRKMSAYIRAAGVLIGGVAAGLIDSKQVDGGDEAVSRKFALIESNSLVEARSPEGGLVHEKVCALLAEKYTKFMEADIDPSFVVALAKSRNTKSLFRAHGLEWLLLLHRPLIDESKKGRLLRVSLASRLTVNSFEVGDELYLKTPGAILVYSH